ncbi:MAG: hypothetical protein IPP29_13065 [Bacteroidetes bacterium]|nr:hypothetical protein [Bacteroidota bacterium]
MGLEINDELVMQGNAFMTEQGLYQLQTWNMPICTVPIYKKYKDAYNGMVWLSNVIVAAKYETH